MNKAKLRKELANIGLLRDYFFHYNPALGIWTFVEGFSRRVGMIRISEWAHVHRYGFCKLYLKEHYGNIINNYQNNHELVLDEKIREDDPIWLFWYQGENNAPPPIDLCIASIRRHSGRHPIISLDKYNFNEYATLPNYILEKFHEGRISVAALSDILRISILREHGGIWLDSGFYMTDYLQHDIYECSFFSISHGGRRKWVISKDMWCLGFLAAREHNDFINYCYDMLIEYWKNEDVLIGYLLLDCIIALGFEEIKSFEKLIRKIPVNNLGAFELLETIRNAEVEENNFQSMIKSTYIHKLTYKESNLTHTKSGKKTYYGRLIEN